MGARFTIPQKNLVMFLQGEDILPGKNRDIKIIFNKKEYLGVIRHVNQKNQKIKNINISNYVLVNKDYGYYRQ